MYCANITCKNRIWTAPAVKGLRVPDLIAEYFFVVKEVFS